MSERAIVGQRDETGRRTGDTMVDDDQNAGPGGKSALPFRDLVNSSVPNVARVYDYILGGKDNFAADREAAAEILREIPDALTACHDNRQFLQRAVRFLAGRAGIRQFIDLGAGLPTRGNVHEIAQEIDAEARVVYVDYDPVVVSHAGALMATNPTVIVINRDLRFPEQILAHPAVQAIINFDEPVAVLLVAVLHFIKDDDGPYEIAGKLKAALSPGSYLVVSHVTADQIPAETGRKAQAVYERATARVSPRSREAIERFFDGLEIMEPGVVNISTWHREQQRPASSRTLIYAGMARKP